jgi:hypothetical protein
MAQGMSADNFNRVRTLTVVPMVIILLTSCSSAAGAPLPVSLVSSTQTITRTEPPLTIPDNIPPGAATVIFEYFRLLNLALETGRTTELEGFVASDCPCLAPVSAIHLIYREGLLLGAKYRISRLSLISKGPSETTVRVESVRSEATQITNSSGARKILLANRNTTDFILENFGGIWLVVSSRLPQ